jgi:hypothetical protein
MAQAEAVFLQRGRGESKNHCVNREHARAPPERGVGMNEPGVHERCAEREEQLADEDPVQQREVERTPNSSRHNDENNQTSVVPM